MKRIFQLSVAIVTISTFLFITSFESTKNENDFIFIRVFESLNSMNASKIIVTEGNSVIKSVELSTMRPKSVEDNALKIATTLNELKKQGYSLVTSHGGGNEVFIVTDYVFEKR